MVSAAVDGITDGRFGEIHSLLIYKDGKLVLEEYFSGHDYHWGRPNFHGQLVNWGRETRHNIHSVGKSMTSACIGIAIDKGFINSTDQPIFDYFPDYQHLMVGGKEQITIEHLLTMTAGLAWDEWGSSYASHTNDVIALWFDCEDPISCILEKPLVGQPGTTFKYSGGNMILLGEIIKRATRMDIETFAGKYLFEPLAIELPKWQWINDTGVIYAGGDQRLTPREMLKFGVVYLNGGKWNDRKIIPAYWVKKSATAYPGRENTWFNYFMRSIPPGDSTWGRRGYSYSWWTHQFKHAGRVYPAYWALGFGGQKIVIFPEQKAVIVVTAGNYQKADASTKILTKYLIPAFP